MSVWIRSKIRCREGRPAAAGFGRWVDAYFPFPTAWKNRAPGATAFIHRALVNDHDVIVGSRPFGAAMVFTAFVISGTDYTRELVQSSARNALLETVERGFSRRRSFILIATAVSAWVNWNDFVDRSGEARDQRQYRQDTESIVAPCATPESGQRGYLVHRKRTNTSTLPPRDGRPSQAIARLCGPRRQT